MLRVRLPLAIAMMSVLMLFAFGTPLLQKQQSQPQSADAFKLNLNGHYGMTREALPFLKAHILDALDRGHHYADTILGARARNHFDNCQFKEGTEEINKWYQYILGQVKQGKYTDENTLFAFGIILHAAQDLYTHSNWVELGARHLIDSERWDFWKVLKGNAFSTRGGEVFVTGGPTSGNEWHIYLDRKNLKTWVQATSNYAQFYGYEKRPALISGLVPYELDGNNRVVVNCPIGARTGHWPHQAGSLDKLVTFPPGKKLSEVITLGTPGLAKDNPPGANDNPNDPKFVNHYTAKRLAMAQTQVEWCRMLNLVEKEPGLGLGYKKEVARQWIKYTEKLDWWFPPPPGTKPPTWGDNPDFFAAIKDCPSWVRASASRGPAAPLDQSAPSEKEQSSLQELQNRMNRSPPPQTPPPEERRPPSIDIEKPTDRAIDPCFEEDADLEDCGINPCDLGLEGDDCPGRGGGSSSSSGSSSGPPDITIEPPIDPPSTGERPGETPLPPEPGKDGGAT